MPFSTEVLVINLWSFGTAVEYRTVFKLNLDRLKLENLTQWRNGEE